VFQAAVVAEPLVFVDAHQDHPSPFLLRRSMSVAQQRVDLMMQSPVLPVLLGEVKLLQGWGVED
jgi:hypothetical protein